MSVVLSWGFLGASDLLLQKLLPHYFSYTELLCRVAHSASCLCVVLICTWRNSSDKIRGYEWSLKFLKGKTFQFFTYNRLIIKKVDHHPSSLGQCLVSRKKSCNNSLKTAG